MSDTNTIVSSLETEENKEAIDGLETFFNSENDIFSGIDELPSEETETSEETTSTEEVQTKLEDAVEEVINNKDDPDTDAALSLFKALKDPSLQPYILDYLNKGKHPANATTEAYNPLVEIRKAFPEGYENIADQLAPALVRVVDKMVEDRTAPLKQDVEQRIIADTTKIVTKTYDDFAKTHLKMDKIPDNYEAELQKLVQKNPWNGQGDVKEYTENLLYMVKGKLGMPTAAKPKEVTSVQKQKSPLSKLAAAPKPSGVQSSGTPQPTKVSLTNAFDAALRSLTR